MRGGLGSLADRSPRPDSCPHQMPAAVEARVVAIRREHPGWGPTPIRVKGVGIVAALSASGLTSEEDHLLAVESLRRPHSALEENDMEIDDAQLGDLLAQLDLHRKVQVLTGRDFWSTWPLEEIGLRSIVLSDGPSGVRGSVWDERSPSLNLPSGSALAASWDPQIGRQYGRAAAAEARRKGVDVVLGPTVNLHRSPLGGRHFEGFSEDPVLTAAMAAANVSGVQEAGVAATPKHYVANDFESERFTADVHVSDRALRELYLLAFEQAVTESRAWLVMSAYNSINGATASENLLLETPLNSEWGFDGVVVSDWTAVRSVNSARFSQDLAMPGPHGAWGDALIAAVERGEVSESAIDRKVRRILRLGARVGALDGFDTTRAMPVDGRAFARRAAISGMVLVENDGILPVAPTARRIAVVGHNATVARTQGGGSATVIPERVVTPLEGIRAAFPHATIDYAVGAVVQDGVADLPLSELMNPVTGTPGVHLSFLDDAGQEIFTEDRLATSYVWFGGDAPIRQTLAVEASAVWTPSTSDTVRLGFAGVGRGVIEADGERLVDEVAKAAGDDLGAALLSPPSRSAHLTVSAGVPVQIQLRYEPPRYHGVLSGAMGFGFGLEPDDSDPEGLLAAAENLASAADLVVLVVGTNSRVESEGFDRSDLRLPGRQDDLARRVLAANSRSVVVVNSGAPVELPWSGDAAAVLIAWFGGQEFGSALADILTGVDEPGGRLPTTWPAALADAPVTNVTPSEGVLRYDEGIHIGYRAWLRARATPRWWFGAGRGYTTFEVEGPSAPAVLEGNASAEIVVPVRNTGRRPGKHVVQLYASRSDSQIERPVRWLIGFAPVVLAPGERRDVVLTLSGRQFAHWSKAGWAVEPGEFRLHVSADAHDEGVSLNLKLLDQDRESTPELP